MWFLFLQLFICWPAPLQPPALFSTTWSVWPALFLQMLLALGFLSPAHLCPMLVLPPSMVLPCGALSFTAPKIKDLQLLVMSRTLYSPKLVQLPCKAPVSASSRLRGWTQRRSGLWRAAPPGRQLHSWKTRLCRNCLCSSSGPFRISANISCWLAVLGDLICWVLQDKNNRRKSLFTLKQQPPSSLPPAWADRWLLPGGCCPPLWWHCPACQPAGCGAVWSSCPQGQSFLDFWLSEMVKISLAMNSLSLGWSMNKPRGSGFSTAASLLMPVLLKFPAPCAFSFSQLSTWHLPLVPKKALWGCRWVTPLPWSQICPELALREGQITDAALAWHN